MKERISKIKYYLSMADAALTRGTCLRRNYGAIIVKNDRILATGYTGAPRCRKNCIDIGECKRNSLNIPSGQRYELCRSVHAEQNAVIQADGAETIDSTIYIVGRDANTNEIVAGMPCMMCKRVIINAGIKTAVISAPDEPDGYLTIDVNDWIVNDDSL